jgi:hypothetical protein
VVITKLHTTATELCTPASDQFCLQTAYRPSSKALGHAPSFFFSSSQTSISGSVPNKALHRPNLARDTSTGQKHPAPARKRRARLPGAVSTKSACMIPKHHIAPAFSQYLRSGKAQLAAGATDAVRSEMARIFHTRLGTRTMGGGRSEQEDGTTPRHQQTSRFAGFPMVEILMIVQKCR